MAWHFLFLQRKDQKRKPALSKPRECQHTLYLRTPFSNYQSNVKCECRHTLCLCLYYNLYTFIKCVYALTKQVCGPWVFCLHIWTKTVWVCKPYLCLHCSLSHWHTSWGWASVCGNGRVTWIAHDWFPMCLSRMHEMSGEQAVTCSPTCIDVYDLHHRYQKAGTCCLRCRPMDPACSLHRCTFFDHRSLVDWVLLWPYSGSWSQKEQC